MIYQPLGIVKSRKAAILEHVVNLELSPDLLLTYNFEVYKPLQTCLCQS